MFDLISIFLQKKLNQMNIAFSKEQISERLRFENPWWGTKSIDAYYQKMKQREYFKLFQPLVTQSDIKRAVVLMGPRRVGKTVMLYHSIQELIKSGIKPSKICYISIETPIYNGVGLEALLNLFIETNKNKTSENLYIFFDEIQYLKEWEVHLKSLVDSYHHIKFIVSGSAAAALKLKSNESGAGRFTEFILPPLTFHEFISLKGELKTIQSKLNLSQLNWRDGKVRSTYELVFTPEKINQLNKLFVDYINFGGYPEVSLSPEIQANPGRYIRNDIIDKVLMRDLPSLYGIQDIQELNSLFTYIAYNSGNEMSLDAITQSSGVAKNTIKKYLTYLESAFLIKIVYRIDQSAKRFSRAHFFKIYLTNPSLRAALFTPIKEDDSFMGNMVETAIFSQWNHDDDADLFYASWGTGEVDIVSLGADQKPSWAVEIKWSNRFAEDVKQLKHLKLFCNKHSLNKTVITTKNIFKHSMLDDLSLEFIPASVYCYMVGRNLVEWKFYERVTRSSRT